MYGCTGLVSSTGVITSVERKTVVTIDEVRRQLGQFSVQHWVYV